MAYPNTSPYKSTRTFGDGYLDVMNSRIIPSDPTDTYWEISATYNLRPDLLAHDLYDDSRLWWVFAARNPNRLADPLFDFATGTSIYLPKLDMLKQVLGF